MQSWHKGTKGSDWHKTLSSHKDSGPREKVQPCWVRMRRKRAKQECAPSGKICSMQWHSSSQKKVMRWLKPVFLMNLDLKCLIHVKYESFPHFTRLMTFLRMQQFWGPFLVKFSWDDSCCYVLYTNKPHLLINCMGVTKPIQAEVNQLNDVWSPWIPVVCSIWMLDFATWIMFNAAELYATFLMHYCCDVWMH